MAMSLGFLLVVFAALCGMAMVIAVLVMMFRAAASSNSRGSEGGTSDATNSAVPPVLGNNSLTNPTHPLHPLHHSSPILDEVTRHPSAAAASIPSFDSGTAPSPAPDCGSPSPSPDGGSGCG
jgi:hypothetical protein